MCSGCRKIKQGNIHVLAYSLFLFGCNAHASFSKSKPHSSNIKYNLKNTHKMNKNYVLNNIFKYINNYN